MIRIILLLLSFNSFFLIAQESCGTVVSDEEMQIFYNRDKSHLINNFRSGEIMEIPIVYHIVSDDDGVGGFAMKNLLKLHCELNQDVFDAEIHFYILDIVYHHNSTYYDMPNGTTNGNAMFNNNNNLNACNIYIVNSANVLSGGVVSPVCGYSYLATAANYLNRNGIIVAKNCIINEGKTLTHEMGHYLNLPHVFSGWEGHDYNIDPISTSQWERVDGSNCSYTGDGFCDTPPDYLSASWSCFSPVFTDPVGVDFTSDEKNYMSYSSCKEYFKTDQMVEMKNTPIAYRTYLTNLSPPNTAVLSSPVIYFPLANMPNARPDTVDFVWNEVVGADYYLFEITTNSFTYSFFDTVITTNSFSYYNLNSNEDYTWRVLAFNYGSVCNGYVTNNFTTADLSSVDNLSKESVTCFGNNDGSAIVSSTVPVNTYNWYKFDETTSEYFFFNATNVPDIYNLTPGNYYVDINKTSGAISTKYFELNEPEELIISIGENNGKLVSFVQGGTPTYTYAWDNGETTYVNYNPLNGENNLYVTDANGCLKTLKYNFVSALNEIYNDLTEINLYPNPTQDSKLFVSYNLRKKTNVNFEIYSSIGKKTYANSVNSNEGNNLLEIDTKSFSKGIYFIKLTINDNTLTKKIIIL